MSHQISVEALNSLLNDKAVKILDGSWALDGAHMKSGFLRCHIPTAQFFDLEAISDHASDLPHMAPSPDQFAKAVGELGIDETDHVVIYDQQGLFSAARVWWTFKLMGHAKVQVLKGGLPAWQAASFAVTDQIDPAIAKTYRPSFQNDMVIAISDLAKSGLDPDCIIFDARSRARFHGVAPEPRAGLAGGHIPQSHSLPYGDLISEAQLKPVKDLKAIFNHTGLTPGQTVVTTCGSGVTAAITALALYEIGHDRVRLYDGSWAEWGQPHLAMPINA